MEVQNVTFAQAQALLDAGAVIVDVREEEEYVIEHVKDAILFPLDSISAQAAKEILPEKRVKVIVYCKSGRRSALGAGALAELGYEVYDVGSIVGCPFGYEYGS